MLRPRELAFLGAVLLVGCSPTAGGDDDDEPTPDPIPEGACFGDALETGIEISDDMDALADRWDTNRDLVRFIAFTEPL